MAFVPLSPTQTILLVDDNEGALAALTALLMPLGHRLCVAKSGPEALELAKSEAPAMVLLDVLMPGMNGFEVCEALRADPETRDLPVVMITALQDRESRLEGLKAGADDFLSKPIDGLELRTRVQATLRADRHRGRLEERELHNATLKGSIAVMRDVLSMVDPESFGRAKRIERMVQEIGHTVGYDPIWELEVAAILCQLGRVVLPQELRKSSSQPSRLRAEERKLLETIPEVSASLIEHIPEFERIGEIVAWQDKRFDGTGPPSIPISGEEIPLGSRIIRLVRDIIEFEDGGLTRRAAVGYCAEFPGHHDPELLKVATSLYAKTETMLKLVSFSELTPGAVTRSAIHDKNGRRLVAAGMELTAPLLASLETFHLRVGLVEPFEVKLAVTTSAGEGDP
jgi:response regulator RpfG family c-di-GMP phosphodiesterase